MGIDACVRDRASEIGVAARVQWHVCREVEMLLGQAEVNEVDALFVFVRSAHYEVGGLDVTVDDADAVNAFDGCKHLLQDVDGNSRREVATLRLFKIGQVLALQFHHDEALLACLDLGDELMHLNDAFLAL